MDYNTMRYYDPISARYLSRDPIWERGGINLYSFVCNSSLNHFDPIGLFGPGGNPNEPRGHADFYGAGIFIYNREDEGLTNPYYPISTWRHFRDLESVENDLLNALSLCNNNLFERYMHQGQDYFSHYAQGYRWWTGHPSGGRSPDNDDSAWQDAQIWTYNWVDSWKRNCCSDPCNPGKFKRCLGK